MRLLKQRRYIIIGLSVLVVTIGALTYLEATDRINLFGEDPPKTIGPTTKGEPQVDDAEEVDSEDEEVPVSEPKDDKRDGDSPSNVNLAAPSGNFVSNHEPNLDGNPTPNLVQSACVTTPGATCRISFTSGNEIKKLPAQTTDAEGATYWNWKLQDIGLTVGEWKITATATLGSQSKTSSDPLNLKVGQ